MRKIYIASAILALVTTFACSKSNDDNDAIVVPSEGVTIGLPVELSRTAVDGERASWIEGDTFSLWARNDAGQRVIKAATFTMMYYWDSYKSAVFTSQQSAVAESTYTYYAVSPSPEVYDNNVFTATYTIPAEQQGDSFNGAYDIMVAEPVTEAPALVSDKVNDLKLDFHHKMHILKIVIAKNTFGLDISRLVLTFPTEVTGTVTIDATNVDSAPMLTNGSKTLTLNLATPINEGDTAWGIICPANITGEVKVMAYATDGTESVGKSITLNKECEEGHITPLHFTTSQINPPTLRFSIGKNNLGEAIKRWSILDQNGNTLLQWDTNSGNIYTYSFNGSITASGLKQYAGKTLVAQFESEHAIVKRNFTMPSTISNTTTTIPAIDVPYLLFEDFTSIHTDFAWDDNKVDSSMEAAGGLLNNYMSVQGWNAARVKGVKGQSVRINARCQSTIGYTHANGRLDTPNLSCLKSGANVKVKLMFDLGCYINSDYGTDNGVTFFMIGTHTHATSSTLNGADETTALAWEVIDDKSNISKLYSSVVFTSGYLNGTFGSNSFGETFPTYDTTINSCTNSTRISWSVGTTKKSGEAKNAHYYLYIDNIRVSIAQ
ncbi:MAG: hypothetical protein IKA49_05965 [Alistipes sp.]|nr:hypothetical protein [Alistipes sp.]